MNLRGLSLYARRVRKRARLATLLVAFSLLCGLVYYIYLRPVYYSKALVELDSISLPPEAGSPVADSRIQGVIKDLQSPHMTERTARRFDLKGSARDIHLTHILDTRVQPGAGDNLEIEVWPTSGDLAAHWAEALVEEFEAYRSEKHERDKAEIFDSYTRELKDAAARMGEPLPESFQITNEQDAIRAAVELQKVKGAPAEIIRMTKRIDEMGRIRIQLEDARLDASSKLALIDRLGEDPQLALTSIPTAKPVIGWPELLKEQERLKEEIAATSATPQTDDLPIQTLQRELNAVTQKLRNQYQIAKKRFELDYQESLDRRSELEGKLDEESRIAKPAEQGGLNSAVLQRSRPNWDRMVSDMQKKIEALEESWKKGGVDLRFISLADNHVTPVSPHPGKLALLSLGLGILLGIGVPIFIGALDHTTQKFDKVETTLGLRRLGTVPKLQAHFSPILARRGDSQDPSLAESFRIIRTNLLSLSAGAEAAHVTMVTSAMPKEGKTVVSSNLAISFAQDGARTLLIDTDLRHGRMHRLFGYRQSPGLSNVLLGEVGLEEACRPTHHENLSILSSGKHLEHGAALLAPERLGPVIGTLRGRFERIVIDTPPVLGLAETAIVQKQVDGVLFVIWSGRTPLRNIKAAIETLQSAGAKVHGFIGNRLDLDQTPSLAGNAASAYTSSPPVLERA